MSLLTYYDNRNLNTIQGKTQRITCGTPSDPVLTFSVKQGETPTLSVETYYEMICHSTAAFEYVGMDYNTASSCRTAMIQKFTRQKELWEFYDSSYDLSSKTFFAGWKKKTSGATVQEAEVDLQPQGGHMYKVAVKVDCEDIAYTTNPSTQTFSYPACMSDVK